MIHKTNILWLSGVTLLVILFATPGNAQYKSPYNSNGNTKPIGEWKGNMQPQWDEKQYQQDAKDREKNRQQGRRQPEELSATPVTDGPTYQNRIESPTNKLGGIAYEVVYNSDWNGLRKVRLNDKFGCINVEGKVIIPLIYDEIIETDLRRRYLVRLNGHLAPFDLKK